MTPSGRSFLLIVAGSALAVGAIALAGRRPRRGRLGHAHYAPDQRAPYGLGADGESGSTACAAQIVPGSRKIRVCAKWAGKPGPAVKSHVDVCHALRGLVDADRESFYTVHMDVRNRVIGVEEVSKGSLSGVEVHPREVFKSAVLSNASSIIMAHNHPSGDPAPSRADVELTERLIESGKMLGVAVLDHVIIGRDGCDSLSLRLPSLKFG